MQEETYYSDGTNWITNQRLIFGDAQYPLGDAINAEMKAEYPQKVMWTRIAVVVGMVILFGLVVFLYGKSDDPLFVPIIAIANLIGIVGTFALSIYSIWDEYRKRPSLRKVLLQIAALLLLVVLILLWFLWHIPSSALSPFWIFGLATGWTLLRILGRRGTFRLCLVERTRILEVFSSNDRQFVENLIGYVRLALVRRTKSTQSDVKSSA